MTKGRYPLQFKLTIVIIIGVLISFSMQGYALFSIIFSTLFQTLNYWFIYRFFQDTKQHPRTLSLRFIKTGLLLGVLSTFVPFVIGYLAAKNLNGSEIYNACVYTFLHLQYNGWFLFVAIGLFFRLLDKYQANYQAKLANWSYLLFATSVLPAISLSLLGMSYSTYALPIGVVAAVAQCGGLILFLLSLKDSIKAWLTQQSFIARSFLTLFLTSFVVKTILQGLSILPALQDMVFHNKLLILSYLHLSLIGVISALFLGLLFESKWLASSRFASFGGILFLMGFFITELLLVLGGLQYYYSNEVILGGSAMMAIGALLLVVQKQGAEAE
jgi:hypothetical protein